jgi:hypothetical protein
MALSYHLPNKQDLLPFRKAFSFFNNFTMKKLIKLKFKSVSVYLCIFIHLLFMFFYYYNSICKHLFIFVLGSKDLIIVIVLLALITILGEIFTKNWKQFLPISYFIFPYILLIRFMPNWNSLALIINILLLHCLITIPAILIHKKLANWSEKDVIRQVQDKYKFYNVKSLMIYFDLSIGILYPYIFGVIILSIRYLMLNKEIDISYFFTEIFLTILFVIFCYLPIMLFILWKISFFFNFLKEYLWIKLLNILYSLHLFLLNYWYDYFFLLSKIHKIMHFIRCYCSKHSKTRWPKNPSKFWLLIDKLYVYPQIFMYIIYFFIILEIIIYKRLFYTFYILFIYIYIKSIVSNLYSFGRTYFGNDTCFSNYVYKNFSNPRYPVLFWYKFDEAYVFYGFQYFYFSEKEKNEIFIQKEFYKEKVNYREKNSSLSMYSKMLLVSEKRFSFKKSISYTYNLFYGIRY